MPLPARETREDLLREREELRAALREVARLLDVWADAKEDPATLAALSNARRLAP